MGLASGVIRVQLFLPVQNSLFCCFIVQIGLSYHIIVMHYLYYEHTGLKHKQFYSLLDFSLFPYNG